MKIKQFVLTFAGLLFAFIANAQTKITIDSIEYGVSGPEAVVLEVNQKRDTVVIPETIEVDGYTMKVTTIGSYAMQSVPAKRVVALSIKRLLYNIYHPCATESLRLSLYSVLWAMIIFLSRSCFSSSPTLLSS